MAKAKSGLADQIRAAVEGTGLSTYQVAKDSGITEPTLRRFLANRSDMNLENAERLMAHLGFTITPPARPAKTTKKGGR